MSNIVFVVEKTGTGFSAYAEDFEKIPAGTTGDTMAELRTNIEDAYNSVAEFKGWPEITIDHIILKYDLAQLFEYFGIDAVLFAERINIPSSTMTGYLNKTDTPSDIELSQIIIGLQQLGKELSGIFIPA